MTNTFRTEIPNSTGGIRIDYTSRVFLAGSCFATHIADKLQYGKLQTEVNPFGILYNPQALATTFSEVDQVDNWPVEFHNERYHCLFAHSTLSASTEAELRDNLINASNVLRQSLSAATHFILTPGTAWVYRDLQSNRIAGNCHKLPQHRFRKELLSPSECTRAIQELIAVIRQHNPKAEIVFTISPIRHLRDGFVENQRSKAHLIAAVHQVVQEQNTSYFPAYEIMMDDLRDYRFYSEDMIHPNEVAINYIWEKFRATWLDADASALYDEVAALRRAEAHRPFNPDSEQHRKFLQSLHAKRESLQQRGVNWHP